jgi:hypothetical protein
MHATTPIEKEADADDCVVQSAAADSVFDAPTPEERIPL